MKKWQKWQRWMCACLCPCVCEVIKANHCKRHITYEATSIIGCQSFRKWVVALWNWIYKHHPFFSGHLIVCWMSVVTSTLHLILVSSVYCAYKHSSILRTQRGTQCFQCACSICSTVMTDALFSAQFHWTESSFHRAMVAKIADSFVLHLPMVMRCGCCC